MRALGFIGFRGGLGFRALGFRVWKWEFQDGSTTCQSPVFGLGVWGGWSLGLRGGHAEAVAKKGFRGVWGLALRMRV